MKYALRLCSEHDLKAACVKIYAVMALFEEAVELALQVDVDLAKMHANQCDVDDEVVGCAVCSYIADSQSGSPIFIHSFIVLIIQKLCHSFIRCYWTIPVTIHSINQLIIHSISHLLLLSFSFIISISHSLIQYLIHSSIQFLKHSVSHSFHF